MSRHCSTSVARMGIDIGKSGFHVVGHDVKGKPVFLGRFARERLLEFLGRAPLRSLACRTSNAYNYRLVAPQSH